MHGHPPLQRADQLLVTQGLCASRNQAQTLIAKGKVLLGDHPLDKASRKLPPDAPLSLLERPPYVSRAGEKLAAALDAFHIDPNGLYALDIGASTGGFTDCLLQRGAAHVTCVDVGHGQLHSTLRTDPRIVNIEGFNARDLAKTNLPYEHYPLIVADLSFISLIKVLLPLWSRLAPGGALIALIKPQFEVGPKHIGKGGIVHNPAARETALQHVLNFADTRLSGCVPRGHTDSPLTGTDGNYEYLAAWTLQHD